VFERFRQAEGSSARAQPGLGLGLALVRSLVELHGGTVRAESAGKDQGSTFCVVLPIPAVLLLATEAEPGNSSVPPAAGPEPPSVPPESLRPPLHHILEGVRVLVVDDEADARDALVGLLERYGARVRTAGSVAEAIAALSQALPQVLISDLGLPAVDGYELIRRVRELPEASGGSLPALAVSAYVTEEHCKKAIATGFQRHLGKPVAPAELVIEVARLAGRLNSVGAS
jgi:CheY-like chemotaxis protein